MARMDGKVALVSGGASGIGEATVRLLAEEGARVAFCDRHAEPGEALERALAEEGRESAFTQLSVDDEAAVADFVAGAASRFGRIDVLVNNAGIRMYQDVTEASAESWREILGVNLLGYVYCAKAAIPVMARGGGGAIVNVASIRSVTAGSRAVQYDTTKAAILGLTRAMARDHAAQGIRVNAVGPGPIYTGFHRERAASLGQTEDEYVAAFGAGTILGRPGTPREVAQAILFLASDDASYVTGTCLFVDGGSTAAERK